MVTKNQMRGYAAQTMFWGVVCIAIAVGYLTATPYGWITFGAYLVLDALICLWRLRSK